METNLSTCIISSWQVVACRVTCLPDTWMRWLGTRMHMLIGLAPLESLCAEHAGSMSVVSDAPEPENEDEESPNERDIYNCLVRKLVVVPSLTECVRVLWISNLK